MKNSVKRILVLFCFLLILCNTTTVYAINQNNDTTDTSSVTETVFDDPEVIEILLDRIKDLPLCLISRNSRLDYLFPNGVPSNESEMAAYITTIEVTVWNGQEDKTIYLNVHKKLAEAYKHIFNELYLTHFPIEQASCYCYRTMNNGTETTALSHHSYGVALDINWRVNPHIYYGYPDESSEFYINEEVVNIFKAHGFYWGGDWDDPWTDWMHFSYTDH